MMFQQLPTAGLPFQFRTWEEYEAFVDDHFRTGVIEQLNDIGGTSGPPPSSELSRCESATACPTCASSRPSPP